MAVGPAASPDGVGRIVALRRDGHEDAAIRLDQDRPGRHVVAGNRHQQRCRRSPNVGSSVPWLVIRSKPELGRCVVARRIDESRSTISEPSARPPWGRRSSWRRCRQCRSWGRAAPLVVEPQDLGIRAGRQRVIEATRMSPLPERPRRRAAAAPERLPDPVPPCRSWNRACRSMSSRIRPTRIGRNRLHARDDRDRPVFGVDRARFVDGRRCPGCSGSRRTASSVIPSVPERRVDSEPSELNRSTKTSLAKVNGS